MPTADRQLTAAEITQIAALVEALAVVREQTTRLASGAAVAAFRLIRSWWDAAEVAYAALEALRIIQPAQLRMAQVTDAYLARVTSLMTGRPVRPVGAVDVTRLRRRLTDELADRLDSHLRLIEPDGHLDVGRFFDPDEPDPQAQPDRGEAAWVRATTGDQTRLVRAADMVDVYSRVAAQYRYQVTEGRSPEVAAENAVARAAAMAETDVTLAHRAQAAHFLKQVNVDEIVGYRRILLGKRQTGGPVCGLCIVAADRVYHKEDLQPIHAKCRCGVLPVTRSSDPGLDLTRDDLDLLYQAASSREGDFTTGGWQLKKVRVAVTEHGELGPILVEAPKTARKSKGRRTPQRVVATTTHTPVSATRERLAAHEYSLAKVERLYAEGDRRWQRYIEFLRRTIAEEQAELAIS